MNHISLRFFESSKMYLKISVFLMVVIAVTAESKCFEFYKNYFLDDLEEDQWKMYYYFEETSLKLIIKQFYGDELQWLILLIAEIFFSDFKVVVPKIRFLEKNFFYNFKTWNDIIISNVFCNRIYHYYRFLRIFEKLLNFHEDFSHIFKIGNSREVWEYFA